MKRSDVERLAPQAFADGEIRVAVVVPCYRVTRQLRSVLAAMPAYVDHIVAVDDACPDSSGEVARSVPDPRIVVIRHERNSGVGGAVKTGFRKALELGADLVVKLDGDGQMDPASIGSLLEPLVTGRAAYCKANRFWYVHDLGVMPATRRIGNVGLSFMTKIASGYWDIADPTNGFVAIRADVIESLDLRALSDDYFFEISLLVELGKRGFCAQDVPLPPKYGDEQSSLSLLRALVSFPPRLFYRAIGRVFYRHFWFDFTPSALLVLLGVPLLLWALGFGAFAWRRSVLSGDPASAGTVMLAGLPLIVAVMLLLQAVSYEMVAGFNGRIMGARRPR